MIVVHYELIILALVCLGAPSLAKFAGYETHRKPFDLVGIAGIFFLLATALGLNVTLLPMMERIAHTLMMVSFVLGWLMLALGAIWGMLEVWREPDHGLAHHVERTH